MKTAIKGGATIWSTSSVYGLPPNPPTAGLHLLRRYFTKYPEDAPKVTLFVQSCFDIAAFAPICTPEVVRKSWEECNAILGGVKTIDVFGPARMDQNVPVEVIVGALKQLRDEARSVGLSEVRAETIRRASAVVPIAYDEFEFSLWSTEILDNGVALAAKECNVVELRAPRNFSKNLDLADKVKEFAEKKGVTPAQLALAWIRAHSNTGDCGDIIPIPGSTSPSRVDENCKAVEITAAEKEELDAIFRSFDVAGHRQIPGADHFLWT